MPEIKARVVLAILSFCLFFVAQMNRVHINLAVVIMDDVYIGNNWDAKVILLGAYYWCYSLVEIPGTLILHKYGCRNILTIVMLICGLGNFLFPPLHTYHPICGIIIRALQGLVMGLTWQAIAIMSAKWIPKEERSKFTTTYQGTAVGTSLTYALGGIVIYNLGWPYIFYITGVLCTIWAVFWWYCAYDTPGEHPRITQEELEYLERAIGKSNPHHKHAVPWKDLLFSRAFLAVFIGTFGIMWFVISIAMQLPPYLNDVHHVNIRTNGLLLCIPDMVNFIFSMSFSVFVDKQIQTKRMSMTTARKFAFIFSHVIPAVLLIFLGLYGNQDLIVAMVLIVISNATAGATSSGNLANMVDISPNNAGIIMGICISLIFAPGVISPIIVKHYTAHDPQNWLPVFLVTTGILLFTSAFYFIFGSGEIQPWDRKIRRDVETIEEESKTLMMNKKIQIVPKKIESPC